MAGRYWVDTSIQRHTSVDGRVFWSAVSRVFGGGFCSESLVQPIERIATVDDRPVCIGEPWPDPTTPVGLERLMAIAERLAVTEWERRFGGVT